MSDRTMRRVGLLTGTFDPVHLGHVALAQAARRACGLDEVWFLVNPRPAHKVGVTPAHHRVAMVRLAVAGQEGLREGDPDGLGAVRHRMADFERLMQHYEGAEFVFVVGADVLADMTAWEDRDPALERARFVVARRARAAEAVLPSELKAQVFEAEEYQEASSRRVQEALRSGRRPIELDPRVYEYIREQKLY